VVVPLTLLFAAEQLLPGLPVPSDRDMGSFLGSDAGRWLLQGHWGWFALIAVMGLLNTVLGEELLFRGVLLPRMQGAFGRGDWVVNGVLFAGYHLHVPWMIPSVLMDTFVLAYPARRYRSALLSIVVHSSQTVVILLLALAVVLGHR
jgi:membrane protease YdiL (CAAX protease family)